MIMTVNFKCASTCVFRDYNFAIILTFAVLEL